MTEGKHTPGPWKLIMHGNEEYPFPLSVHTEDGSSWIARDGSVSSKANARLIAAAPDLLAALEALVENPAFELGAPHIEGRRGPKKTAAEEAWNGFVADARAALTKAKSHTSAKPASGEEGGQ